MGPHNSTPRGSAKYQARNGALVWEGHFGSLSGLNFYRIPEVPEGRLASVLIDSPARSSSCAS
jgi:hypothetical protein